MVVKTDVATAISGFGQPSYGLNYARLTGYCPVDILVPGCLPWGPTLVNWHYCSCNLMWLKSVSLGEGGWEGGV